MTTTIRTFLTIAILAVASWTVAATASHAQCTHVDVTNNASCDLQLCLFSLTGAAPVCFNIPTGSSTITFPAGFVPVGAVSSGGNSYRFSATGCTVCFSQTTTHAVICCATVCFNSTSCRIKIDPCTSADCNP